MVDGLPTGKPAKTGRTDGLDLTHRLTLNAREAAVAVAVAYPTFMSYRQQEHPPPRNAPGKKYYLDELVEWVRQKERRSILGDAPTGKVDLNPVQERARKDKELADRTALENQVRRAELIDADTVIAAGKDMAAKVKSRLLRVPVAAAPLVVGQEDRFAVQTTIDDMIRDALTELSVEWTAEDED